LQIADCGLQVEPAYQVDIKTVVNSNSRFIRSIAPKRPDYCGTRLWDKSAIHRSQSNDGKGSLITGIQTIRNSQFAIRNQFWVY
jgi:hypothetical protein